ncbi:unnamed protein product [Nezara viridula]|uniref:Uncharacterized protein n=1 Tax=Nezara viridula TaxID=85310 RepID=A0A9P0HIE2_NEZVI|nr:unnamed protein product [Nezara viridula]
MSPSRPRPQLATYGLKVADFPRIKRDINNTIVLAEGDDLELSLPPMVKEASKSMEKIMKTDLYRRVVLRCPLIALPEPKITWYKLRVLIKRINRSMDTGVIGVDGVIVPVHVVRGGSDVLDVVITHLLLLVVMIVLAKPMRTKNVKLFPVQ